ncbi:hypothetical protein AB0N12_23510 [Streptomyces albogriseolus]|uniref:hypothetical protein n=1 Tax=Streptomyces albogriseolus TaxID=1887 RepID=UPI00345FA9DE
MQLDSIATVAPLFTAGAALIVGGVTRWTQRGVAADRIRWEGKLEVAKFDAARFESTLQHFIEAADAGSRYVVALADIDATDFKQREKYVFAILEPVGRARVEAQALPNFPGIKQVRASIAQLGTLVSVPDDNKDVLAAWDPNGIGDAITALSRGRSWYMHQTLLGTTPRWRQFLSRSRTATRSPQATSGRALGSGPND